MDKMLLMGCALLVFGSVELVWAVRSRAATHFVTQAILFGEMGVMALALALIKDDVAQISVLAVLGVGALPTVWMYVRALRRASNAS